MSNQWPVAEIETALGASFKEVKPGVHSLLIVNPHLGTRTRLEIAPEPRACRVWSDRNRSTRPTFVGRLDVFGIKQVRVEDRQVVFSGGTKTNPNELLVTANGTFRVVIGIDPQKVSEIPNDEPEAPEDPELETVIGILGRPQYAEPNNKPFWRAGIGEMADGSTVLVWTNVKAWNGVAAHAKHLERGSMVKATGRMREETYTNREGEEVTRQVLHCTYVEPVG